MSTITYTEQKLSLPGSSGKPCRALLRSSTQVADQPMFLLNLAKDCAGTLNDHPYRLASDVFLAAGHHVGSFDLPNHGENANQFGEGLDGMAAAIAAGVNVFEQIQSTSQALIKIALQQGLIAPGRAFASGTSRGGLSALHAAAASPDIAAAAIAPVTHLPVLREFAPLADSPLIQAANASALLERLATKPIFIAIGLSDSRVGTSHCLEFFARLQQLHGPHLSLLHVDPGEGHRASDASHYRAAAFLLDIAGRIAAATPAR